MSIYRCKVPVGIEVFEVSNDQNQASINALPICLPSHPDPSKSTRNGVVGRRKYRNNKGFRQTYKTKDVK